MSHMPFPWDSSGALEAESQGQRECWAATNALGLALQNGFNMTSQSQVQETLPRLGFDLDDTPLHGTIPVGQWAAVPGASTSAPPLVQSRLDGSCGQMNRSDPGVLEYVQQPWHDVDRQTALGTWVDAILPNGQMDENPTQDMQLYMPDEDLVLNWTLDCFGHGKPRTGKTAVVGISQALGNQRIVLRVHKHGAEDHDAADAGAQAAAVTQQPLSLVDHDEARRAVANYIPGVTGEAFRRFLGPPDGLPNKTFRQACALYKDPATPPEITQLIRQLFTVWTASRIVSMPAFLVGDGVAGTTQPPRCAGQLPPLLALQLKAILTNYIRGSLRSDVLRRMQAVIYGRQECPWLVAYLTTFILLHNTSLLVAFEVGSLGKDAMTVNANNLLGHFHYYTKGHYPFSASCSDLILHADLGLDSAETDFVYESRRLIAQQGTSRHGPVALPDLCAPTGARAS
ncbi:hypothetical protein UVI_02045820 [Ustilaginoidea virens]|uniref:Uncharacterized protein n=1 Tax=Ustilaginoidea virens TaxID=1159556 RepID=A0A1B5L8A4_USTVR|nr:hypothetical protein UVI_02045820 [Ustilaginoidea virens]